MKRIGADQIFGNNNHVKVNDFSIICKSISYLSMRNISTSDRIANYYLRNKFSRKIDFFLSKAMPFHGKYLSLSPSKELRRCFLLIEDLKHGSMMR